VSSLPPFGQTFFVLLFFLFLVLFLFKALHKEQYNKTNKPKQNKTKQKTLKYIQSKRMCKMIQIQLFGINVFKA